MTNAAERVKAARERDEAAAEAEAPEPDGNGDETPEPAPEPEQPQPTERQVDRVFEQASNAARKQAEKVAKLLGLTEDGLIPCPCCDVPGYAFAGRAPLEGDRLLAVKAVSGEDDVRQYRTDPNAVECENCNGLGKLLRPTKVPDQQLAICATCNGYGWHSPMQQVPPAQMPPTWTNGVQDAQHVYYPQQQPVYPVPPNG